MKSAAGRSKQHYIEYGFRDKEVSFATRLTGALLYFERATTLAEENKLVDIVPNLYLRVALTNQEQGKIAQACKAFDASLRADQIRTQNGPSKKVITVRMS